MIARYTMTAATPSGHPLDVSSLQVSLSDTWAPYVQGTLVAKLPPAPVLTELDPRQAHPPMLSVVIVRSFGDDRNRIAKWAELTPGSTVKLSDLTALGFGAASWSTGHAEHFNGAPVSGQEIRLSLAVDGLDTDERDGTLTLDLGGAELRLQDMPAERTATLLGDRLRDPINEVLTMLDLGALGPGGEMTYLPPVWEEGSTAWDVLSRWLDGIEYRLIFDETGRWRLVNRDSTRDAPPVTLAGLTQLSRKLTRRDWHDGVLVIWRWEGPDPSNPTETVPFTFREYSGSTTWTRPLIVERDAQYPGPWLADELWRRYSRKGEVHQYTAPADLTVRPLDTLTITDSAGTRTATITTVTLAFPAAKLTVSTRED